MIKFLLYIVIIWFLVRVISRLFMPRIQNNRRRQSVLQQILSQLQNQAQNGSGSSHGSSGSSGRGRGSGPRQSGSSKNKNLDDIEEAEFEDITDEDK